MESIDRMTPEADTKNPDEKMVEQLSGLMDTLSSVADSMKVLIEGIKTAEKTEPPTPGSDVEIKEE